MSSREGGNPGTSELAPLQVTLLAEFHIESHIELKVEFINDVAAHYGSISQDPVLGRIDS